MKIFFGSQTGTAEDFARELSNEASARQFSTDVVDLESYMQEDPVCRLLWLSRCHPTDPSDSLLTCVLDRASGRACQ
jgi:sulfite reductase alpha subunit-like flavoprotein